jgi:hypothetical protein
MTKYRSISPRFQRKHVADGYIVIIVLLLTAVLLMLGLSLATRTTEEVYQSGQEADTTRVFNAAETGIENALYLIQTGTAPNAAGNLDLTAITPPTGSNALLDVAGTLASDFDINIDQGEVLTLQWKSGTEITWSYTGCPVAPALIVTLYNTTGPTASHLAYDPFEATCNKGSSFVKADSGTTTSSTVVLVPSDFNLADATIGPNSLLRIRPLYADAAFSIENSSAIKLISTASDNTTGSRETRKIQVIRTEPAAPSVFDYAVFSGGALTKP